ncbi:MAG: hypothetical protein HOW73_37165 [Polyangiaceae bacterium]|nr:hypothetical protein [Polyangiaceae bacterium]
MRTGADLVPGKKAGLDGALPAELAGAVLGDDDISFSSICGSTPDLVPPMNSTGAADAGGVADASVFADASVPVSFAIGALVDADVASRVGSGVPEQPRPARNIKSARMPTETLSAPARASIIPTPPRDLEELGDDG